MGLPANCHVQAQDALPFTREPPNVGLNDPDKTGEGSGRHNQVLCSTATGRHRALTLAAPLVGALWPGVADWQLHGMRDMKPARLAQGEDRPCRMLGLLLGEGGARATNKQGREGAGCRRQAGTARHGTAREIAIQREGERAVRTTHVCTRGYGGAGDVGWGPSFVG